MEIIIIIILMLIKLRLVLFLLAGGILFLTGIESVSAQCNYDYSSLCKCCATSSVSEICYSCTPLFPRTVPCSKPCEAITVPPTPPPLPGTKLCHEACSSSNECSLGLTCEDGECNSSGESLIWSKRNNTMPTVACDSGASCSYDDGRLNFGSSSRGDAMSAYFGPQKVIKDGSVYKMWYGAWASGFNGLRLYYATSSDGLTWTKYDNTTPPVSNTTSTNGRLGLGTSGRGDDERIQAATVIKDDDGTFKMWYVGQSNGGGTWDVYYATSPDGLTWTKYDNTLASRSNTTSTNGRVPRGLVGSGDYASVTDPYVLKDGSVYKMWYTGQDSSGIFSIFYATSPDGLIWTKYDNSIQTASNTTSTNGRIPQGLSGSGDSASAVTDTVIKEDGIYKMWYTGNGNDIFYATSPDGLAWTKYDNSPVDATNTTSTNGRLGEGLPGSGDTGLGNAMVIKDGGMYKMWYGSYGGAYYATMTIPDCSTNLFQCSQSCSTDANCATGLNCISNFCRNSECPSESSCNCVNSPTANSSLVDAVNNNYSNNYAKHVLVYDNRNSTVVTDGSVKLSFAEEFDLSMITNAEVHPDGGGVSWGVTTISDLNNTIVIPFSGSLTTGKINIVLGNSNDIYNPADSGTYNVGLNTYSSSDGSGNAIDFADDDIIILDADGPLGGGGGSGGVSTLSDTLSNSQMSYSSRHTLRYNIGTETDIVDGSLKVILPLDFVFSGLVASDINTIGGDVTWGVSTIDSGTRTVIVPFTGTLGIDDGVITIIIGYDHFVNNPETTGAFPVHLTSQTESDGSGTLVDDLYATVYITGGITVSATVPSSLTFSILPVTTGQTINGNLTSVATTSSLINFGSFGSFEPQIAAQDLQVATNATSGYIVTLQSSGRFSTTLEDTIGHYEVEHNYALTSPNYPLEYPDNYENTWTINEPGADKINVNFTAFDTEDCCDYVDIMDGSDNVLYTYRGLSGAFTTPWIDGDTVKIHFYTDSSVTYTGWAIDKYFVYSETEIPDSEFIASKTQSISSPDYPSNYPDNYDNTWTITQTGASKLRINFSDFSTYGYEDYVQILDSLDNVIYTYYDEMNPFSTGWVDGDTIKIRFYTDSWGNDSGWSVGNYEYPAVFVEGDSIDSFDGTNDSPVVWHTPGGATHSLFGYTTSDYSLNNLPVNRFQGNKWSGINATPYEVMYNPDPSDGTGEGLKRVGYQIEVDDLQAAGTYTTNLTYICTATF